MRFQIFDKILSRCFLVVLSFSLIFAIIEIVSRKVLKGSYLGVKYNWMEAVSERRPKPYTMFSGTPNQNGLNSLGYMGKIPPNEKNDEYRIFVVGGSTAFYGNPNIPSLIEAELRKKISKKISVYNFSFPSSKSGEELARIIFEIVDYSPNMVIVYDGANDIWDPSGDPRPGYPFDFRVTEQNPLKISNVENYPTLTLMAFGSHFLRYFFYSKFADKLIDIASLKIDRNKTYNERIDFYLKNMTKMMLASQSFNFKLAVFFQPTAILRVNTPPEEKQMLDRFHIDQKTIENCLYSRNKIVPELAHRASKGNFHFSDLSTAFDQEKGMVFGDPVHIRGEEQLKHNSYLAKKISEKVAPLIRF